jgi:hypothetical protein
MRPDHETGKAEEPRQTEPSSLEDDDALENGRVADDATPAVFNARCVVRRKTMHRMKSTIWGQAMDNYLSHDWAGIVIALFACLVG